MEHDEMLFDRLACARAEGAPYTVWIGNSTGRTSFLLADPDWQGDSPAWSPDGTSVAFRRASRATGGIAVVGADGREPRMLPTEGFEGAAAPRVARAEAPSWSPEGSRIVFTAGYGDEGPSGQLIVVGIDGSSGQAVVTGDLVPGAAAWSPTDDVIAFAGFRRGAYQPDGVFLVGLDGSPVRQITDIQVYGRIAWSPDGMRLAMCTEEGHLWVVGADGSNQRLVRTEPLGFSPAWTPGGTHIAYEFASGACNFVYVIDLAGAMPRPLLDFAKDIAFAPATASSPRFGSAFVAPARGSWWAAIRETKASGDRSRASVTIDPEVAARIAEAPRDILFQVRDVADSAAAIAALDGSRTDIRALENPGWKPGDGRDRAVASLPLPTPVGPLMHVLSGDLDPALFARIPGIVARHLTAYGVSGTLAAPDPPIQLGDYNPVLGTGVGLHAYPAAPEERLTPKRWRVEMPDSWLEAACAWVTAGLADDAPVRVTVTMTYAWLPASALLPIARHCHRVGTEAVGQASFMFVAGDRGSFRGAHASFMGDHNLLLAGGNEAGNNADRLRLFDELVEVAGRLGPTMDYGFVRFEDPLTLGRPWTTRPDAAQDTLVERQCDEVMLDAYPYQVIGPGHLARLRSGGVELSPLARRLGGNRYGLPLGEVQDWIADASAIQELVRRPVAPLLLSDREARDLLDEKDRRSLGERG